MSNRSRVIHRTVAATFGFLKGAESLLLDSDAFIQLYSILKEFAHQYGLSMYFFNHRNTTF